MYDMPETEKEENIEKKGKKKIRFGHFEGEIPEGLC
jgi:hypothetical protein